MPVSVLPVIEYFALQDVYALLGNRYINVPSGLGFALLTIKDVIEVVNTDITVDKYDDEGYLGLITTGPTGVSTRFTHVTKTSYGDKRIRSRLCHPSGDQSVCQVARYVDANNLYYQRLISYYDRHQLIKRVAGSDTVLAEETGVLADTVYDSIFQISGTTLRVSKDGGATWLTATDTAFTSGKWGYGFSTWTAYGGWARPTGFGAPASPIELSKDYFEVEIAGDGSEGNPFRANVPTGKYEAFIPTGLDGRPLHRTCIVRAYGDLVTTLTDIATKISVEDAKRRAKEMDRKIKDEDLIEW